jgi:predicted transcriptional regulator
MKELRIELDDDLTEEDIAECYRWADKYIESKTTQRKTAIQHAEDKIVYQQFLKDMEVRRQENIAELLADDTQPEYKIQKLTGDKPGFVIRQRKIVSRYYYDYDASGSRTIAEKMDYIKENAYSELQYKQFGNKFATYEAAEKWLKKYIEADNKVEFNKKGEVIA